MALQILTEKTDAAQRQQAMNQLQQAGGPNMPTIAQSLQERAKQALSARMMQAQQQAQQHPQPQPIQTAEPADQPEVSPEMLQQLAAMHSRGTAGVDQLPSNMGENYAGGGIIAFAGEDGSYVDSGDERLSPEEARAILERMRTRNLREKEKEAEFLQGDGEYYAAPLPAEARASRGTLERFAQWAGRNVERDPDTGEVVRKEPKPEPRAEVQQVAPEIPQAAPDRSRVVSEVPPGRNLPQGIVGARNYVQFQKPQNRTEPTVRNQLDIPSAPRQAPVQPPAPAAPQGILTPEQADQVKQVMLDRLNLNPYERERMAREEAEKFIGAPETASLQSLADELAAKRQNIARQREENQGLREWMRGIALAPRGLTSAGSAVAGSEYVRGREKQFEAQDFEALQKMLETQAKISDVKRGWKKDLFTIGKAEFDRVYKDKYDAAKELGKSDAEAKKMAQEAVLEREKMANQLKVAGAYTEVERQKLLDRRRAEDAYKRANPKATDYEAYMAVTSPTGYLAEDKQLLAELSRLAAVLKDQADIAKNPDEASRAEAARQLGLVTAKIASMGGINLGGVSAPPPGAVRLKQ